MSKECEIILPEEKECKEEESDSSSLPARSSRLEKGKRAL